MAANISSTHGRSDWQEKGHGLSDKEQERNLDPQTLRKHFLPEQGKFLVKPAVKSAVSFKRINLFDDSRMMVMKGMDIICAATFSSILTRLQRNESFSISPRICFLTGIYFWDMRNRFLGRVTTSSWCIFPRPLLTSRRRSAW
jgi:hypothetical protein